MELQQGQSVSLLSMHQDQVTAPANGFEVIAGCNFCTNYITRYKNQVLTIQTHPEFSAEFFLALLKATKQKYSNSSMQKTLKTSGDAVDKDKLNKLIKKFIEGIFDSQYEITS